MCGVCNVSVCVRMGFVMCGCFGNICVFTIFCIVCNLLFVLFRLCTFILICFVCTSVGATAAE